MYTPDRDQDLRWIRRAIDLAALCPPVAGAYSVGAVIVGEDGTELAAGGGDADYPRRGPEFGQPLEDSWAACDGARHQVDVFLPQLRGGLVQVEDGAQLGEVAHVRPVGQLGKQPLFDRGSEAVCSAQAGHGVAVNRLPVDQRAVQIKEGQSLLHVSEPIGGAARSASAPALRTPGRWCRPCGGRREQVASRPEGFAEIYVQSPLI